MTLTPTIITILIVLTIMVIAAVVVFNQRTRVAEAVLKQTPNGRSVDIYKYRCRNVYFVDVDCCDFMTQVYELDGTPLGSPSGGLTGRGDGRLPAWEQDAVFVSTVIAPMKK